uniref:Uncharacterized protein n=1 Tax=Oryza brachyantha TaxID=4533 RepID=J3MGP3_ORYBR
MAGDSPAAPVGQTWTTGLCDCCDDCNSSCGIASIIYCWMRPTTVCPGLYTMYSWSYRQKLRATFGMAPDPCTDCCLQFFCERCSLSQMYRELKNRGINPANGNSSPSVHSI